MKNIIYLVIPAAMLIGFLIFILSGYVKASPDVAIIVSGLKQTPKVLIV